MWVIVAVLLLISLALFVRGWLDKTRTIDWRFFLLGISVSMVARFLVGNNDYARDTLRGFLYLLFTISFLIALPILRRRMIHPYVRVNRPVRHRIFTITGCIFGIAFFVYLPVILGMRTLGMIIFRGGMTIFMIIGLILTLFEKIKICGNGVWCSSAGLWPWTRYKSFSWGRNTKDSVELRLKLKQRFSLPTTLMVLLEDREAVQQLFEPNLPEQPITIDI